jgi:hypothetical protein
MLECAVDASFAEAIVAAWRGDELEKIIWG